MTYINSNVIKEIKDLVATMPMNHYSSIKPLHLGINVNAIDQIFYYSVRTKECEWYNKISERYYTLQDSLYRIKQLYASMNTSVKNLPAKLLTSLAYDENELLNTIYFGVTNQREITFIRNFGNNLIKYSIDFLIDDIVERSINGINGPFCDDAYSSRTFMFIQRYNVFDKKLDDKHFIMLNNKNHQEVIDYLKSLQEVGEEIEFTHEWVVFKDTDDYHFFSILHKESILFNATFKNFREQVVDGIIFHNTKESDKNLLINCYNNVDLIDKQI